MEPSGREEREREREKRKDNETCGSRREREKKEKRCSSKRERENGNALAHARGVLFLFVSRVVARVVPHDDDDDVRVTSDE